MHLFVFIFLCMISIHVYVPNSDTVTAYQLGQLDGFKKLLGGGQQAPTGFQKLGITGINVVVTFCCSVDQL